MRKRGNRTVTGAFVAIVVVALGLATAAYLRTTENEKRLDARNLRDMARIARAVEAQLANYPRNLDGLREEYKKTGLLDGALLVPGLSLDTVAIESCPDSLSETARLAVDVGGQSLRYSTCAARSVLHIEARWPITALLKLLKSDHFDILFVADDSNSVIISSADGGIQIHDLGSLTFAGRAERGDDVAPRPYKRPGGSGIEVLTIADLTYRMFFQPVRIRDGSVGNGPRGGFAEWTVGGLVPAQAFRKESIALRPSVALTLGFLVALGLLSVPFIRIRAMGPRESLRFRHVVSVAVSLTLLSGLAGLALADLTHFRRLQDTLNQQFEELADLVVANLDHELSLAVADLKRQSRTFRDSALDTSIATDTAWSRLLAAGWDRVVADTSVLMKTNQKLPGLHMIFWTDTAGTQIAKWTPRSRNTPRVSVAGRDYFREIKAARGWRAQDLDPKAPVSGQYYVESIRSWTTGEYLAAVSVPFCWSRTGQSCSSDSADVGISAAVGPLQSLDQPVRPPGVGFLIVDETGNTSFHWRHERNLEENFVEEVEPNELVRSVMSARIPSSLDATYRGTSSRLIVRPLKGRPLWLITVVDKAQLGTLRFEVWFIAGALYLGFAFLLLLWFAIVEKTAPRVPWVWPDRGNQNKHSDTLWILAAFSVALGTQLIYSGSTPPHPSSFVVPFQALGLGFVVLTSHGGRTGDLVWAQRFGWVLAGASTAALIAFQLHSPSSTPIWVAQVAATLAAAAVAVQAFRSKGRQRLNGDASKSPFQPPFEATYLATIVLGLAVVGVLPGYLYYRLAFHDHVELLVRHHQVSLARDLAERSQRLGGGQTERSRTLDLAFEPVFETAQVSADTSKAGAIETRPHGDLHPALLDNVPWLTDVAISTRSLRDRVGDYRWVRKGGSVWLTTSSPELRSRIPDGLWRPNRPWWILLGLFVISAGALVLWLGRRVFLINLDDPRTVTLDAALPQAGSGRSLIVVCTRSTDRNPITSRAGSDLTYVDLIRQPLNADGLPALPKNCAQTVCVDHFDHRFQEPAWNRCLLSWLEDVAYSRGVNRRALILLTSREPDDLVTSAFASEEQTGDRRRWNRLFGRFVKLAVADGAPCQDFEAILQSDRAERLSSGVVVGSRDAEALEELYAVLREECGCRERLHEVGKQMLRRPDFMQLTPAGLRDHIREAADPYYTALWSVLGQEQRLVLAQLASGAIANPKSERALRQLLARGLLERAPELRLMNSTFTRFVRGEAPPALLADWERSGEPSTWQLIRVPLVIGWIALALFLFWTQREVLGDTLAFLGTAGVGLAGIIRLLTLFQKGPGAPVEAAQRADG